MSTRTVEYTVYSRTRCSVCRARRPIHICGWGPVYENDSGFLPAPFGALCLSCAVSNAEQLQPHQQWVVGQVLGWMP
jgi:hypothetical protein